MGDIDNATGRRLRVIEIAVLADDGELQDVQQYLEVAIRSLPARDADRPIPWSMSCYDGSNLPRSLEAELLEEIDACQAQSASAESAVPAPGRRRPQPDGD